MKKIKVIVDPPSGWKHGFPCVLEEGKNLIDLLREKGYPEKDIDLALKHTRMWKEEDET